VRFVRATRRARLLRSSHHPLSRSVARSLGCFSRHMPPSRQERRKAQRDAAKRAPARSGAGAAGGAAPALANLHINPLGDWSTQAEDPTAGPAFLLILVLLLFSSSFSPSSSSASSSSSSWDVIQLKRLDSRALLILPCSPRHRMSFNSRAEGSNCGSLRGERYLTGPTPWRW
jgi:hypothetical protein